MYLSFGTFRYDLSRSIFLSIREKVCTGFESGILVLTFFFLFAFSLFIPQSSSSSSSRKENSHFAQKQHFKYCDATSNHPSSLMKTQKSYIEYTKRFYSKNKINGRVYSWSMLSFILPFYDVERVWGG